MDDICRLCCSSHFVNNNIFDEEKALYLKMSLYLPIKVFKNDRLPQKICDKCSCKINDFYQFCNETIDVQNRLRRALQAAAGADGCVNLTRDGTHTDSTHSLEALPALLPIKRNTSPTLGFTTCSSLDKSTQTDWDIAITDKIFRPSIVSHSANDLLTVKEEPLSLSPVKEEALPDDQFDNNDGFSDNSDNESLLSLKKKKKDTCYVNGDSEKCRNKKDLNEWETLMGSLPLGTALTVVKTKAVEKNEVKPQLLVQRFNVELEVDQVKSEINEEESITCCICFTRCYSRVEMLAHYRKHAEALREAPAVPPPPPPPPPGSAPDAPPLRCSRCRKALTRDSWAPHWARHYARDARPYSCALCDKTFRNETMIFNHAKTHAYGGGGGGAGGGAGAGGAGSAEAAPAKRFVCDMCPESFVYMKHVLAHRTRRHPEAAARALALRCAVCGRQFAHTNSLRRHLRAHSGERNFLCNVCGKALSSHEHLKFHIRIHTGHKPHACATCGKAFVKKCNLTLHERVHSGEKPYVCSHCGKAFSQRSTLVIHERYHSGARPYECGLCGRGFVAKGLLSMHLKNTCI